MAHFVVTLAADYFERRGPYKDPPAGATYVFDSREAAEALVRIDPYATDGVATEWTVAP